MRLLNITIVMSTLRRIEWRTWLPPIDSASPSPVMTHTMRSGRAALRPVARGGARAGGGWQARREPGGGGRRGAVERGKAVLIHVVREPAGAADPRDEHDVLLRVAEVGHHLLGLGEDRVVAAARAPADLLIRHEVLPREPDDLGVLGAQRRLVRDVVAV